MASINPKSIGIFESVATNRWSAGLEKVARTLIDGAAKVGHAWPALEEQRKQEVVQEIRRARGTLQVQYLSDSRLKSTLQSIKTEVKTSPGRPKAVDYVPSVFAIVDECIRRRLGAWRLFDDPPRQAIFGDCFKVANGETGASKLDAEEIAIVQAIKLAQSVSPGRYGLDLQFPASFYRAVEVKDAESDYRYRPTDEQLLAGVRLLEGKVVEMQAGEGKTVAIAFSAVMYAVLGRSVHILTANDYLAERDCRLLAEVYHALGFSVEAILDPMDDFERKAAYKCDIVYGTLRQFGFDYLRDNLARGKQEVIQPLLQVAIVDEVDQALIDEADTPLIIAGVPLGKSQPLHRVNRAVAGMVARQEDLAGEYLTTLRDTDPSHASYATLICLGLLASPRNEQLRRLALINPRTYRRGMEDLYPNGNDSPDESITGDLYYIVDPQEGLVTLTEKGMAFLEGQLGDFNVAASRNEVNASLEGQLSRRAMRRLDLANQVYQSLRAHLILEQDVDYVVADGSVFLLDKYTGRLKPDNSYQDGLQPALQAKEGVAVEPDHESLAQISVQGFVTRYQSLAGITGTASNASEEFWRWYSLKVVSVPTTHPSKRSDLPTRIFLAEEDRTAAIVAEVVSCNLLGRPVLAGVQTVEQSWKLSQVLQSAGIPHKVLNAVNSFEEAEIVRDAGNYGAVTVATNMAGRGTDVVLATDLDRDVLRQSVSLVRNRLAGDCPHVRIRCNSRTEAQLLRETLLAQPGLRVGDESKQGCYSLLVSLENAPSNPDKDIGSIPTLDFGLGLHVVSSEFNQFPRVALQLKGRSGRQGNFGSSRALLSWDDQSLLSLGRRGPNLARCRRVDDGSRTYFEGNEVERFIRNRQIEAETEAAHRRSVLGDYSAVVDEHCAAYYEMRRQLLNKVNPAENLPLSVADTARHLVESHFPRMDLINYANQFTNLAEDARHMFEIDLSSLRGVALDEVPHKLAEHLLESLEVRRAHIGKERFNELARQLLLECGDEAWLQHRKILRRSVFSSVAASIGHKSAVADYIIHAAEQWERFQETVSDLFISRTLTFPLPAIAPASEDIGEDPQLSREIGQLVA